MESLVLGVLILLIWPPLAAFLFALVASLFGPSFGEYPYTEHLVPHVVPRLSVLMAVVAILVVVDFNNPINNNVLLLLTFLGVSNATLSMQFIKQTRTQVVEGGPPPPPALLSGADNQQKMKGKVVVVSGANSGIGKETARALAAMGATVVMACRSVERAQAARRDCIESIQQQQQQQRKDSKRREKNAVEPKMDILKLDLSSLASVREAAAELNRRYDKIDILINNAGLMMGKQETTVDGHELVMQANHLGHYLLTRLLVDHYQLLRSSSTPKEEQESSDAARILILTSSTYVLADRIDLEDLFCQKGKRSFTLFGQYAQSKLANILFANELARRYNNDKHNIFVASIHPGLVRTDVVRNMPWYLYYPNIFFSAFIAALQKTPAQGAWNTLYLATTNLINDDDGDKAGSGPDDSSLLVPATASGCYWVNRAIQEKRPCAKDRAGAVQLWEDSAKYVGLTPEEQRPAR